MGDGSLSSRRQVSGRSVREGVRAMGAVQAGFIIYFPWSRSRAVLEGPLSLYIYYTYQLMMELFGTPRIRSDFRSSSDALLKPSTHSPDRLLTCASSEDFSHSRSSFSLAALESSARGHSSFCFSTSRSSSKVAYAFRLLVPIIFPLAVSSPHPFHQFLFPCILPSRCTRALGSETRLPPRTFQ